MNFINFNGRQVSAHEPVLNSSNRAFKYGDGLFETIRVFQGQIPLAFWHFKRLFHGMDRMKICADRLTEELLLESIIELCKANECLMQARVRLQVYRGENNRPGFIIEAVPLPDSAIGWNEKGWSLEVFHDAAKSTDSFANLKSSNFLPYVMAENFAKENLLDDAVVLNVQGKVADTSRANIFLIRDDTIYSPSLSEGCVNGVMRSWLIENLKPEVIQTSISIEDILAAREVFLTNAVFGIRWVRSFQNHSYSSDFSRKIYSELISTIFS